ncbi:unnamed protein product [Vitrella brassicaformis CCMP3155]|uniref:Uncharacterized protein n=1 Tax=Vitrella brassicaformis (strain CCMP3155) TaxID=1169540 RepID=A0A0G4FC19_VITBC|nr:unnamed protein product [Vitrella brassicaformis CCMP3155]|eukprot:CEM10171.1 unnamed protein product [Vitrella brassicaformis CCMP3155]
MRRIRESVGLADGEGLVDFCQHNDLDGTAMISAFVGFNSVFWLEWGTLLLLCARNRPLAQLYYRIPSFRANVRCLPYYARIEDWIYQKAMKAAKWRVMQPIPRFLQMESRHFVFGLMETFILWKVFLPFLIPLNMWVTMQAALLIIKEKEEWEARREEEEAESEEAKVSRRRRRWETLLGRWTEWYRHSQEWFG